MEKTKHSESRQEPRRKPPESKAELYLSDAQLLLTFSKDRRSTRGKVFELVEAILSAREAIHHSDRRDVKIRSAAGKIQYDAREALCRLAGASGPPPDAEHPRDVVRFGG